MKHCVRVYEVVFLISYLLTFLLALALTGCLKKYALSRNLMDLPSSRSSHDVPTPRGGGLAVVLAFTLASIWLWWETVIAISALMAVVGGGLLVAAVGFWDDHRSIPRSWRLAVHLIAATWALSWLGGLPEIPLVGIAYDLGWLGAGLGVIGLTWLLNLYNFMDGIDGIAGVETITVALGAATILFLQGEPESASWLVFLSAATIGFLVWNWPPATIFMGDVGSGYLGFVLGALAIATSGSGAITIWSWMILLGVFVVDATITLLRRISNRDIWYEPHRCHAYQLMSRRWASHARVTLLVAVINIVWLLPLAWFASEWQQLAGALWLVAYFPLIVVVLWVGAGRSKDFVDAQE